LRCGVGDKLNTLSINIKPMSAYSPPIRSTTVFNPSNFLDSAQQEDDTYNDARYVQINASQTIAGDKTFSSSVVAPNVFTQVAQGSFTIANPALVQYANSQPTVSFGITFASAPRVIGNVRTVAGANGHNGLVVSWGSISTTQATLTITNTGNVTTTGNVIVNWIAFL
jgi:hypothetical protein